VEKKALRAQRAPRVAADCYYSAVSRRGIERFSFEPLVKLYPGVSMGTRADWCPELETLAVNLLLHANPAWHGVRSARRARHVTRHCAKSFALQCLASFAGRSWALAAETILDTIGDQGSEPRPLNKLKPRRTTGADGTACR
jgi:hypothetical protein